MPQTPDLLTMLQSGVHFGHRLSKRNPKMKPYIFTSKSGFHIIDLEKTQVKLAEALTFVTDTVAKGGSVLFLGTKRQAQAIVSNAAKDCGMPYINERWLGGTFTNFPEISRVVKRYVDLKNQQATGELDKYTKKEKLELTKEIEKLEKMVGGIETMTKLPDVVFIVGADKEKTAVKEANAKNIPVVALCDTNVNLSGVAYPIPSNDDAVKSIELMVGLIAAAVKEGQAKK